MSGYLMKDVVAECMSILEQVGDDPLWRLLPQRFHPGFTSRPDPERIPREIRALVKERDGMACWYCSQPVKERAEAHGGPDEINLEHLVNRNAGGPSTPENLVVSCRSCNSRKGSKTREEWARIIQPVRPIRAFCWPESGE